MTTIFTDTKTGDDTGNDGFSFRQVCTITGGAQSQVRVTFKASSAATLRLDHASIGIQTGTQDACTATPVELLFAGVSGFSISNGATITSDWANLSGFTSSNKLIVVMDASATAGSGDYAVNTASTGQTLWFAAASASYNVAAPGFASSAAATCEGVTLIETQVTNITVTPGAGAVVLQGWQPVALFPRFLSGTPVFLYSVPSDTNPNDVRLRDPTQIAGAITSLPGVGALHLTGLPPSMALRVFPGFGAITITGPAPTLRQGVQAGVGSLLLTGFPPALLTTVKPGAGAIILTGPAPSLAFVDHPGFGAVLLTGFAPTVSITAGTTVNPGFGALVLTGFAPQLSFVDHPGFGGLLLTGFAPAPTITSGSALPGAGALLLTGFPPTGAITPPGGSFQYITTLGGIFNPGANAIG